MNRINTRMALLACGGATALLVLARPAAAQTDDAWKVSGSMRLRHETLDGQVRPGFNAGDELVSLRTILSSEYHKGALRLVGEMHDSRVWGANRRSPVSTSEVNTFELVQAYLAIEGEGERLGKTSIQAGRFMLNLGSRRLVAADDYRNTTNGYTGVRADLAPGGVRTTLIYVQPILRLPDGLDSVLDNAQRIDHEGPEAQLWGGTAAKARAFGPATFDVSYFHFVERDRASRPTRDRELDSFSARLMLDPKPGRFDYEVEAIGQTGTISAGTRPTDAELNVRAGFAHADVGYTFVHAWKPRLSAEFDIATGDEPGGRYTRFDTLFGMRRADFGPSGIYAAIGRTNIVTPGLRLEIAPSPRWEAFGSVRSMWLEAKADSFSTTGVRDAAGRSGDFAGAQIEGRWRYWIVKDALRAEVNALWLHKGRFLEAAPNSPRTGDETYLSTNLTAQF